MKRIYKYVLNATDCQTLALPKGAQILSVTNQQNTIVLYAMVNPDEIMAEIYSIRIHGTGHPLADNYDTYNFLGTVKMFDDNLMFHVFWEKVAL